LNGHATGSRATLFDLVCISRRQAAQIVRDRQVENVGF